MSSAIHSFSPSHSGIAIRYERQPARRRGGVGLEQPLELDERLLVEADEVELGRRDARLRVRQYATACDGKRRVVLLAREALLLRRRDDAAVLDQAGGRVVVVGGDAEDAGRHN